MLIIKYSNIVLTSKLLSEPTVYCSDFPSEGKILLNPIWYEKQFWQLLKESSQKRITAKTQRKHIYILFYQKTAKSSQITNHFKTYNQNNFSISPHTMSQTKSKFCEASTRTCI